MIEMTSTKNTVVESGISPTLTARMGTGGNQVNAVLRSPSRNEAVVASMQGFGDYVESEIASSCKQRDYKDATDLVCGEEDQMTMTYQALGVNSQGDKASTMRARDDISTSDLNVKHLTVRRLTPLEAERLQGYPDQYTNIPGASDSNRYKALGNSIALPAWEFWARRFVEMGGVKTIGSLFAGIGGFELVFHRAGCETLWNSEIDNFCQQVVKYHHDKGEL